MPTQKSPARPVEVFCDFDGTITKGDVVDAFLDAFASPEWLKIEALWRAEQMGSRECLERQIACVRALSAEEMDRFVDGIELDPHFLEFARGFKRGRITILSDGFDFFIERVLKRHKLDLRYFANRLIWSPGEAPRAAFPHFQPSCKAASGICKCAAADGLARGRPFAHIGDGQSDFCVAGQADVVLAKGKLARYCAETGIKAVEYKTFAEVIRHFKALDRETLDVH